MIEIIERFKFIEMTDDPLSSNESLRQSMTAERESIGRLIDIYNGFDIERNAHAAEGENDKR